MAVKRKAYYGKREISHTSDVIDSSGQFFKFLDTQHLRHGFSVCATIYRFEAQLIFTYCEMKTKMCPFVQLLIMKGDIEIDR